MTTVLIVGAIALAGYAASLWIRGYRSEAESERASAVVHDLAYSTRAMHRDHQTAVLGQPDDDGPEAA